MVYSPTSSLVDQIISFIRLSLLLNPHRLEQSVQRMCKGLQPAEYHADMEHGVSFICQISSILLDRTMIRQVSTGDARDADLNDRSNHIQDARRSLMIAVDDWVIGGI